MSFRSPIGFALAALLGGTLTVLSQSGAVIAVASGGNLQEAIDRARPGDTITLEPGATFAGNFVLPAKNGDQFITIRTADPDGVPSGDDRVQPSDAGRLAKLKSSNAQAVLRTNPGAHHWRLQWLEFQANAGGNGDIILLGDGSRAQQDLSTVPHDLIVDRCYIHGDPTLGQKRGIALNSASTSILNSYMSDFKAVGQDTQAVAGWNGPGPFRIENNYLEAAGENIILGGTDPAIANLVPSDVTIRRNLLSKPREWRGMRWSVKNLLELKNARRVLIESNVLEYNWQAGQSGFAIVITPRNSGGSAPWATVEDVIFRSNVVRHVAAGFNILGEDNVRPSGPARRIQILNNLFFDVNSSAWGGNGAFLQIGDGPSDVHVQHNTILQTGNLISAYGGTKEAPRPIVGFIFENNIARHNRYGVFGSGRAYGRDSLSTFFPGAIFTHNVLAGGDPSKYPGGNYFPSLQDLEHQFVDFNDGDFRLGGTSGFRSAASDGSPLGANLDALPSRAGQPVVDQPDERTDRPQEGRKRLPGCPRPPC